MSLIIFDEVLPVILILGLKVYSLHLQSIIFNCKVTYDLDVLGKLMGMSDEQNLDHFKRVFIPTIEA